MSTQTLAISEEDLKYFGLTDDQIKSCLKVVEKRVSEGLIKNTRSDILAYLKRIIG